MFSFLWHYWLSLPFRLMSLTWPVHSLIMLALNNKVMKDLSSVPSIVMELSIWMLQTTSNSQMLQDWQSMFTCSHAEEKALPHKLTNLLTSWTQLRLKVKALLSNIKLEWYGLISKLTQVEDAHGSLETQPQTANSFKNLSKLWKAEEELLEFMQVLICGMRFLEANKFVQTSVHILFGMLITMEKRALMTFIQTSLVDGQNQL